jgi:hypothetical protein
VWHRLDHQIRGNDFPPSNPPHFAIARHGWTIASLAGVETDRLIAHLNTLALIGSEPEDKLNRSSAKNQEFQ